MNQNKNNQAVPLPLPVRFHPSLPMRLEDWIGRCQLTTQKIVTATEAVVRDRHHKAWEYSKIRGAGGVDITVFALHLWYQPNINVFYSIEHSYILVRGYGWDTKPETIDDDQCSWFFRDTPLASSTQARNHQCDSEQNDHPAAQRLPEQANQAPSTAQQPFRHKAGPYSYGRDEDAFDDCWLIYAAGEEGPIASLPVWDSENGSENEEVKATAKLLAAAPQMLATLKLMDAEMAACTARYGDTELYWLVRAAITEAGHTPAPEFGVADASQMLDKTSLESHRVPRRVAKAITHIYEYLWREEKQDCFARPRRGRKGHIWWALVTLKALQNRSQRKISIRRRPDDLPRSRGCHSTPMGLATTLRNCEYCGDCGVKSATKRK